MGRRQRRPAKGIVQHRKRPQFRTRSTVHVKLKVMDDVGSLRTAKRLAAIREAFGEAENRFGTRLIEFTVDGNLIHLTVEAKDSDSLSQAIQGFSIRLAKAVNAASNRKGKFFADRFGVSLAKKA